MAIDEYFTLRSANKIWIKFHLAKLVKFYTQSSLHSLHAYKLTPES